MRIASILLIAISILVLYYIDTSRAMTQGLWVLIGLGAFLFAQSIDPAYFKNLWLVWYAVGVTLLIFALLSPAIRGSNRWILLFGYQIQAAEFFKPLFIVSMAGYISTLKKYDIRTFLIAVILFLVPFLLIFQEPDLGNSIILLITFVGMLIVSSFPVLYYLVPGFISMALLPVIWMFLAEYQKARITSFINPTYDVQGAGYNAYQSLIAVGSGRWFGKGLGEGTQSGLSFLPEFHTDFIYATTVEQLGFVGGFIIICLYFWLLFSVLRVARTDDMYQRLVTYGIFSQLLAQVVINIGMNIGLVPITGITLPLMSFGGSSLVATMFSLGLLLRLSRPIRSGIAIGRSI